MTGWGRSLFCKLIIKWIQILRVKAADHVAKVPGDRAVSAQCAGPSGTCLLIAEEKARTA